MQHTPEPAPDWFQSLDPLIADPIIGPATKWVFYWLWRHAGGRPGQLSITTRMIATDLGRSARAVSHCIAELEKHQLIEITDRDRRGVIYVYVYRPNPGGAETTRPADPQRLLPLQPDDRLGGSQTKPSTAPDDRLGGSPDKPSTAPQNGRGGLRAETAAAVSAQKPPAVSAQKPPSNVRLDPQNTGNREMTAAVSAQKPPPRPHGIIERDLKISHNHRALSSMDHGTMEEEPSHVSNALADALAARVDPAATRRAKAELVAYLQRTVGDPAADLSIYRRAADLVIEHNYAADELERLAESVRDKRRAGTIRSPGAYFLTSIRHAARRCGLPWTEPAQPKQE